MLTEVMEHFGSNESYTRPGSTKPSTIARSSKTFAPRSAAVG